MKNKIFLSIILVLTLLTTACSSHTITNKTIEQENLLKLCTGDTPLPTEFVIDKDGNKVYTGKEVMRVLTAWQAVYNTCAATHDELVKAIRDGNNFKL